MNSQPIMTKYRCMRGWLINNLWQLAEPYCIYFSSNFIMLVTSTHACNFQRGSTIQWSRMDAANDDESHGSFRRCLHGSKENNIDLRSQSRSISVRDEFRIGGLKSLARIFFFHCLHENQVVLPEYYLIFCPKMATCIWKILGGGGRAVRQ